MISIQHLSTASNSKLQPRLEWSHGFGILDRSQRPVSRTCPEASQLPQTVSRPWPSGPLESGGNRGIHSLFELSIISNTALPVCTKAEALFNLYQRRLNICRRSCCDLWSFYYERNNCCMCCPTTRLSKRQNNAHCFCDMSSSVPAQISSYVTLFWPEGELPGFSHQGLSKGH